MIFWILFFWGALFVVFYSYLGYGMVLAFLLAIQDRLHRSPSATNDTDKSVTLPPATLLIAAYNEQDVIAEKLTNSLNLEYPQDKLSIRVVTDGSEDETVKIVQSFEPRVKLLHQPERRGKVAAINRAMETISTPVVVFTDANAILNSQALFRLVKHYADDRVGGVAGEKRIQRYDFEQASGAGEGLYWRYESALKQMDARWYSVVGAAGELFSIRTDLFEPLEPDTLLDDFIISMRIADKGYRIAYESGAYALEPPSADSREEFKRKVRICAGGLQSIIRLRSLLNPFGRFRLWFQYCSHRVLRWTITPVALIFLFVSNGVLAAVHPLYLVLCVGQIVFYTAALIGWGLEHRKTRYKLFFVPFYVIMMNVAVVSGFFRLLQRNQSVLWEKAKRSEWEPSSTHSEIHDNQSDAD